MPDTLVSIRPSPIHAVRWAAVLAGMVVGVSLHVVLTLVGAALGFALSPPGAPAVPLGAGLWHGATMAVAACVGGYLAARTSGLRRLADGVLHGAVSWGATTVLFVLLTLSAIGGAVVGGLFSLLPPPSPRSAPAAAVALKVDEPVAPFARAVLEALAAGNREEALRLLTEEGGMSAEQARRYAELATPLVRPTAPAATPPQAAAVRSGWLAGAIILSLLAGVLGGGVGARGARRFIGAADDPRNGGRTRPGGP